jgi:ERCC4-type nuclease
MFLLIDYREKDFIEKISKYCALIENEVPNTISIDNKQVSFKVTSLPIADFIIQNDNEEIMMAIERKSISDLCSSITDGRFREQKQRLLDSIVDPAKISYVIEGSKSSKNVLPKKIINGAILNLIYKHNYKVIHTENKIDTFDCIIMLYTKFSSNDINNINSSTQHKLIKKSESIQNNKLANILCLIPGVSKTIAQKIVEKYSSLLCLINEYNQLEDISAKQLLLTDLQITNTRKIGKALSKKIYEWLNSD